MKKKNGFTHEWKFDLPWHMVDLKDWFYMVDVGYIEPTMFLHVRIFGVRSLWTFQKFPIPKVDWTKADSERTVKAYFYNGKLVHEEIILPEHQRE